MRLRRPCGPSPARSPRSSTRSGSAAYAFAETFGWKQGLDQKLTGARYFYGVMTLSTAVGVVLDFTDVNAVKALYWSAVLNGLLAPFLLLGILAVASDRKIMKGQPSSRLALAAVLATTLLMGLDRHHAGPTTRDYGLPTGPSRYLTTASGPSASMVSMKSFSRKDVPRAFLTS